MSIKKKDVMLTIQGEGLTNDQVEKGAAEIVLIIDGQQQFFHCTAVKVTDSDIVDKKPCDD